MENTTDRKRRSVRLTKDERRALRKYLRSFDRKVYAAEAIGISRPTLDLVLIRGTGNSDTVGLIREKLNSVEKDGVKVQ